MAVNHHKGRTSVFRGKDDGIRVQGVLTDAGGRAFERHRRTLGLLYQQLTGKKLTVISDADVIEYLALGSERTVDYLRQQFG